MFFYLVVLHTQRWMTNLMNEKMLELFLILRLGKRNEQNIYKILDSILIFFFIFQISISRSSVRDINSRNVGAIMQNYFLVGFILYEFGDSNFYYYYQFDNLLELLL